jgi:hypothetical protein
MAAFGDVDVGAIRRCRSVEAPDGAEMALDDYKGGSPRRAVTM